MLEEIKIVKTSLVFAVWKSLSTFTHLSSLRIALDTSADERERENVTRGKERRVRERAKKEIDVKTGLRQGPFSCKQGGENYEAGDKIRRGKICALHFLVNPKEVVVLPHRDSILWLDP